MSIKILTVFGTRPEVIKLAPFIKAVESDPKFTSVVCATSQHEKLQNDFVKIFGIKINHDLNVMRPSQDLFHITDKVLMGIKNVLESEKPDFVVVQGDTTTTFTAALAAFYKQIPVVHLEAGLRTGNILAPYPEEANRSLVSRIATFHITPTMLATKNLEREGIVTNVHQLGNTIVDAVDWILKHSTLSNQVLKKILEDTKKIVLVTAHRRENFGEPLARICTAVKELALENPEITFVWPVHPNPNISTHVKKSLGGIHNIHLSDSLIYNDLIALINASSFILSDSGGIQEECCILRKKILILREETERIEVIEAGWGSLVGSNLKKIKSGFSDALANKEKNDEIADTYGKPGVCNRILNVLFESTRPC